MMRGVLAKAWLAAVVSLNACGGGGASQAPAPAPGPAPVPAPAPAPPPAGGNTIAGPAPNVSAIIVDAGPSNTINLPFVSVTICAPGSTVQCQTIDHVLLDTGSSGLRIVASVLSPSVVLPQQQDANGASLVACTQFADGVSWGPVKKADVKLSGELASALPVQIIGDPAFSTVPAACSSGGPLENTVATFGSNGVLGIGVFREDCGSFCATHTTAGIYYGCTGSGCQPTLATTDMQVQNPVAQFAVNNNGVIVELPPVAATGAASASGSLVFGIGTQANNGLGSASIFTVDPDAGVFTTIFNSLTLANSFIDSGSSVLFFQDPNTPTCSGTSSVGLYCPAATQVLSATNRGLNGVTGSVDFSIANADSLLTTNAGNRAFDNLGAPTSFTRSFDWGLPFFFGRNVFTAIEDAPTSGGVGPYFAY
jgi:Protein of unknown function (DUF3443)